MIVHDLDKEYESALYDVVRFEYGFNSIKNEKKVYGIWIFRCGWFNSKVEEPAKKNKIASFTGVSGICLGTIAGVKDYKIWAFHPECPWPYLHQKEETNCSNSYKNIMDE